MDKKIIDAQLSHEEFNKIINKQIENIHKLLPDQFMGQTPIQTEIKIIDENHVKITTRLI